MHTVDILLKNHKFLPTLNIPAIDKVRLDVYVTTRNSLISIANAIVAPTVTFNTVGGNCSCGNAIRLSKHLKPGR